MPPISNGFSNFAMKDDPLGDFELMGESNARRIFLPSNAG